MKKRTAVLFLTTFLFAGTLVGCAKTPSDSLVKMKGKASEKNYEEAVVDMEPSEASASDNTASNEADTETHKSEKQTSGIRTLVNAPETYKSEVVDETGNLKIRTDAVVEIPNADKASAIQVSQRAFDQELIDRVSATFFPGAKFYSAESYWQPTKADLAKNLNELKGYLAEGNMDPFGWGTDENGNYTFDLQAEIENLEMQYESTPEEKVLEEVAPRLDETGHFSAFAQMQDGAMYQYSLKSYASMPMEISIAKVYEQQDGQTSAEWRDYYEADDLPSKEEIQKKEALTLEEARALAQEKVDALEIPEMELTQWEYATALSENTDSGTEVQRKLQDVGYLFHYTRHPGGIPITYTMNQGGSLEQMDSDMETWCYEMLDIYVGSDGICKVNLENLYDIGETKTEQVNLMSFNEIVKIYEKMMLIQNAQMRKNSESVTYDIDRISFGYTRIYEPSTDSRSGILVPVWDFFGGFEVQTNAEAQSQGAPESYTTDYEFNSWLTINAIDGSIIDRGLGY